MFGCWYFCCCCCCQCKVCAKSARSFATCFRTTRASASCSYRWIGAHRWRSTTVWWRRSRPSRSRPYAIASTRALSISCTTRVLCIDPRYDTTNLNKNNNSKFLFIFSNHLRFLVRWQASSIACIGCSARRIPISRRSTTRCPSWLIHLVLCVGVWRTNKSRHFI